MYETLKKTYFQMFFLIPPEVSLEILQFLTGDRLETMQMVSYSWYGMIKANSGLLPLRVLPAITFDAMGPLMEIIVHSFKTFYCTFDQVTCVSLRKKYAISSKYFFHFF